MHENNGPKIGKVRRMEKRIAPFSKKKGAAGRFPEKNSGGLPKKS